MSKKSDVLIGTMREKWNGIKSLQATVEKEERSFTEGEKALIDTTLGEVREIELEIEKERKEEALHKSIKGFDYLFEAAGKKPEPSGGRSPQKSQSKNPGDQFVESEEFLAWFKSVSPNGRVPDGARVQSPPVKMKGLFQKTLVTGSSDTSAGAFVVPEDSGIYEPLGRYPLNLRSLISVRRTTSDTVEFVRQTAQVTQAAPVAEANVTDYTGATGEVSGEKPEAAMAFQRVQEVVKTLAVWIPATKRAMSDVAQLSGLINDELFAALGEEFEDQLLNGSGVGEEFTGLENVANTLAQAFDTDIAVTARKAITNLLVNGRQIPTAWLFNPQDWEAYDLLTDDSGRYLWGGPLAQGPRTLWGVPVAQSFFKTQGSGWLGNWRKMVVWDAEDANISMTDSHADFFIRNMVAVLAEMRAAMGVIRPSAFCEVDLSAS